ncbi:MAG TPA: peptide chain release factor N(5)-glutamine methyltransferase [Terriglobales bacterium]|nr:peptide chain release factor N(5)-glutamine methyltransferase [Terriglobales bacterium]
MPTLQQALAQAVAAREPRISAEVMLARVLGRERSYLYAHPEAELTADQSLQWRAWLERRAAGEPLQHIVGEQEFYGRLFTVGPDALIPRPETELVVQAALDLLPGDQTVRIADVGTGSGCIAITLALERPRARVIATDISPAALTLAGANAKALGANVEFSETDLLAGIAGPLDLVVSNPPYLAESELPELAREVRDHEPHLALVAGPAGDEIYRRLIPAARERLRPGGWLILELGYASALSVRALFHSSDWQQVEIHRDLQGWNRVLQAQAR